MQKSPFFTMMGWYPYGEIIPPNGKCLIFRGLHRGAKSVFGRLKIAAFCRMLLISSLISLRNAA